ncbi:MAG: hypothetical protein U9N42_07060 [Campylobacterota bacterium]|nr:hypothetical protein [Campylobacterota bacterium]
MPINKLINDNCKNRVKAILPVEIKTEAILVFTRTALERYFKQLEEAKFEVAVGTHSDTVYVYNTLRGLLINLQQSVVNVDYFMKLVQECRKSPKLKELAKYEDPLISYYDVMATTVSNYYKEKPAYLPEFLVICVLSHWVLEEEKSTNLYPFLKDVDFLELISKFENSRKHFEKNGDCIIDEIFEVSSMVVEKLKSYKYRVNKSRVSKTRKKK